MSANDYTAVSDGQGRKVCAAAATPERLTTDIIPCREVAITALATNTDKVAIGFSNAVRADAASEAGIVLAAGEKTSIPCTAVGNLWLDVAVNGEGVAYAYKT